MHQYLCKLERLLQVLWYGLQLDFSIPFLQKGMPLRLCPPELPQGTRFWLVPSQPVLQKHKGAGNGLELQWVVLKIFPSQWTLMCKELFVRQHQDQCSQYFYLEMCNDSIKGLGVR